MLGRFRKVPRKLHEGSAMVFLRVCLAGKVPQGSAKVPRKLREGSPRFRESCGKVPQGSAKVPRELREGSVVS